MVDVLKRSSSSLRAEYLSAAALPDAAGLELPLLEAAAEEFMGVRVLLFITLELE